MEASGQLRIPPIVCFSKHASVPTEYTVGWGPQPTWTGRRWGKKSLVSARNWTTIPVRPSVCMYRDGGGEYTYLKVLCHLQNNLVLILQCTVITVCTNCFNIKEKLHFVHIAHLRQECHNLKFGIFELLVQKETYADELLTCIVS
jgi:hypothetical protein